MSKELARKFHEVYERLAPDFGYETRKETRDFDPESPNGKLMIRVCGEVCGEQQNEIERLRELLRQCVPYIAGWTEARELFGEILKEVGDE